MLFTAYSHQYANQLLSPSRLRKSFQELWAGVCGTWAVVSGRKAVGLPHGVLFTFCLVCDGLASLQCSHRPELMDVPVDHLVLRLVSFTRSL